ncbi:DNA adenine methylase [Chloroflexota bacterium]
MNLKSVLLQVQHKPRLHAAVWTKEYFYSQLIPYIGNKRKLLPLIARGIHQTGCQGGTFVDIFTGSTVVARLAKVLGMRVIVNDWEPFSYEIGRGTVALNTIPDFRALGGVEQVFEHLNALPPFYGYIAHHLCPLNDEQPDPKRERMFFTRENGERIDTIREEIESWEREGKLSEDERAFLLSSLLYAVSYASNTSGVFKGFHNGWGGKTGTALYRIRGHLRVNPPVLFDNNQSNLALNQDAHSLAKNLPRIIGKRPDIVYIDPPYNQHPYGSNYHVLNTVALWDKPPLNPSILVNGKTHDKSAIRKDWRTTRRSPYNSQKEALPAFRKLVGDLDARWLLVSYSTDGTMPLDGLLTALAERGRLQVFVQKYKRYRVSTPRMSPKPYNAEFLAVLDTESKPSTTIVEQLTRQILQEEAGGKATGILLLST